MPLRNLNLFQPQPDATRFQTMFPPTIPRGPESIGPNPNPIGPSFVDDVHTQLDERAEGIWEIGKLLPHAIKAMSQGREGDESRELLMGMMGSMGKAILANAVKVGIGVAREGPFDYVRRRVIEHPAQPLFELAEMLLPGVPKGGRAMKAANPFRRGSFNHKVRELSNLEGPGNRKAFLAEFNKFPVNPLNPRERILNNTVVDLGEFNGIINFETIRAIQPGKGDATKTLKQILALADKHRISLVGDANPFFVQRFPNPARTLNKKELIAWYKRHGFEISKGRGDDRMIYTPKSTRAATEHTAARKTAGEPLAEGTFDHKTKRITVDPRLSKSRQAQVRAHEVKHGEYSAEIHELAGEDILNAVEEAIELNTPAHLIQETHGVTQESVKHMKGYLSARSNFNRASLAEEAWVAENAIQDLIHGKLK